MQKLVEVKRRMKTVRSIRSVARTMATVASAKLSRARERAAGIRCYTEEMRGIVQRQQAYAAEAGVDITRLSPYLIPRPVRSVLLLHLSGDRGMCGAYNMAINRVAAYFVDRQVSGGTSVRVIARGAKGERYLRAKTSAEIVEAGPWPRAGVTLDEVDRLFERLSSEFMSGEADEVWCSMTRFYSPLRRQPRLVRLLPIAFEPMTVAEPHTGAAEHAGRELPGRWFYEPALAPIVSEVLSALLRLQVEDVLLESYASEQGARMITMEEATERADRTLQELVVAHNRLRREAITSDLIGVLFASRLREEQGEATGRMG